MKLKTLSVCVALLAIASLFVYLNSRPSPPPAADARVGHPLVDTATASAAARLHLADQGKVVDLGRDAAGAWVVTSYYNLPVDFTKLSQFMNDLVSAKVERFVTANPDRLARLDLKDSKIELLDKDGKSLWAITVGKSPDAGGHFFEFGTEPKAFQTGFSDSIDSDPKNWADAQLTTIKDTDVAKLELHLLDGSDVTVSRAKAGDPWTADKGAKGRKVSADKISALLSATGSIRFSDTGEVADPALAVARKNLESAKLTTFAGKSYAVSLYRKPEEKKVKAPAADAKAGPASLGKLSDVAGDKSADEKKPATVEYDTIPAGPVYVSIEASDKADRINSLMAKRSFQTDESAFTAFPMKLDDVFEAPPAAPAAPEATPAKPKE